MYPHILPCPTCGCESCTCTACEDNGPDQLQLVMSGFTDAGSCSNCNDAYNGTFILDRNCDECEGGPATSPCHWLYVFDPACTIPFGLINRIIVRISVSSGNSKFDVYFRREPNDPTDCFRLGDWVRDNTTTPFQIGLVDCSALVDYEVPVANPMGSPPFCAHDGSSVFITSL